MENVLYRWRLLGGDKRTSRGDHDAPDIADGEAGAAVRLVTHQ